MWIDQMTPGWRAPAPGYTDFIRWRTRVMVLRARMLAFVQQILAFITAEVLDKQWRAMEKRIKKVQTVEDLLGEHESFMDSCLKDGMLTGTRLLKVCTAQRTYVRTYMTNHVVGRTTRSSCGHAQPMPRILRSSIRMSTMRSERRRKRIEPRA